MAGMLRHRLHFGPYATPRFRLGQRVEDERRGLVCFVGIRDGPIPWPIGQTLRAKSLVLYRGLARAVARESNAAVAHWFIEAMRQANLGRKLSAATRAKMSAAHKARGTWPPAAKRRKAS